MNLTQPTNGLRLVDHHVQTLLLALGAIAYKLRILKFSSDILQFLNHMHQGKSFN